MHACIYIYVLRRKILELSLTHTFMINWVESLVYAESLVNWIYFNLIDPLRVKQFIYSITIVTRLGRIYTETDKTLKTKQKVSASRESLLLQLINLEKQSFNIKN